MPSHRLFDVVAVGGVSASREAMEARLGHAVRECRLELEGGLTPLATIGNSAPFIGLFGTVWGIMHALQGLGGEQALSMDMVAGPVAEALVATAAGLFTAIPAVVGYNLLLRRLRHIAGVVEGNALRILDRTVADNPARGG
ncbi:MAG: MotA/TolQ/ExbB proton channel family protein [Rhodospirillales bacterium]|nr:MotA/TolQ/ExbB proton channel family protein [Rhodospirillales bacterium]MCW8862938.1 MotA/TolQ/ExbB proton channel family protein [Rhodospirillales bacterium]MCW8953246.1 MotA/TolQ/ExbB proton channel family protein [Rhodospirillales bacterium]MCW9003502.1 MotA/TolQ/ExbB proton channel family protein [Rhodospirillales bacterium]